MSWDVHCMGAPPTVVALRSPFRGVFDKTIGCRPTIYLGGPARVKSGHVQTATDRLFGKYSLHAHALMHYSLITHS